MPPNDPSLERTATGGALGPRNAVVYAASRGPSAPPAAAAQLERSETISESLRSNCSEIEDRFRPL